MTLGIDGRHHELEVCAQHELHLLQTLGRYTMAARKASQPVTRRHILRTTQDRRHSREVRAWALASGHRLPERGRIPLAVLRDYAAAHPQGTPGASP